MSVRASEIVHGHCDTRFRPLRDAFRANFNEHGELGAAVAVYHAGEPVVDLWGGVRDRASGAPWERDTIACMMSVSKGIAMICVAMLAARGQIALEQPMASYWPEFGQAGKERVTVREALGHLAGIPSIDGAREGDFYDWSTMVEGIAAQRPLWPVGSRQFYHSATLGFMAGELVRRVTGETIGKFLRREISEPLGADFFFGLTGEEQRRCATMVLSPGNSVNAAKRAPAESLEARMWKPLPSDEDFNSERWRGREIPSVNGQGSARAVARIYSALSGGGRFAGIEMPHAATLAPFLIEQKPDPIPPEGLRLRMAVGFMLNSPPGRSMGPNLATFGHSGAGGSQGFCDPVARIGFCYTTNKMHDGLETGIRATSLIEALYASPGLS
ncbi:MAG: beta-lactamase family protein [Acetobacteraceae bacterium]|nr:beta-lactamase family protein [Acetobacteraceae bacterium]